MIENMPWLNPAFGQVATEVKANRLAHALLVQGDRGIGIEVLAEELAGYRLCPSPTDRKCRQCKSCQLLAAGSHPDIVEIAPSGAAEMIKVDQIREAVTFLSQTPQIGEWKIVLIRDAHRMNINAANALLKVLEEPPGNSLLLLVTDRPQILIPTIRSRCRLLQVNAPDKAQTIEFCRMNQVPDDDANELCDLLGPKPTLICDWVNEGLREQWSLLHQMLDQFASHQCTAKELTDALGDLKLADLLEWLMRQTHDSVKKAVDNSQRLKWLDMYSWLMSTRSEIERGGNLNRQLLLDECFLRWKGAKVTS